MPVVRLERRAIGGGWQSLAQRGDGSRAVLHRHMGCGVPDRQRGGLQGLHRRNCLEDRQRVHRPAGWLARAGPRQLAREPRSDRRCHHESRPNRPRREVHHRQPAPGPRDRVPDPRAADCLRHGRAINRPSRWRRPPRPGAWTGAHVGPFPAGVDDLCPDGCDGHSPGTHSRPGLGSGHAPADNVERHRRGPLGSARAKWLVWPPLRRGAQRH